MHKYRPQPQKTAKPPKTHAKKYPIAQIPRHKKTPIREQAYSVSNSCLTLPNKTLSDPGRKGASDSLMQKQELNSGMR